MKKLRLVAASVAALAIVALFSITSCEKATDVSKEVEVSFKFYSPDLGLNKKTLPVTVEDCNLDAGPAEVVHVVLYDGTQDLVFDLNILSSATNETQVIKLDSYDDSGVPINYEVKAFWVTTSDPNEILYVSPQAGQGFDNEFDLDDDYLVGKKFTVDEFSKLSIEMWVFCYMPENVTEFGFRWFQYTAFQVKPLCFFGDVCSLIHGDDYEMRDVPYNPYFGRDLGLDFHAIYEVIIRNENGDVVARGTNYNDTNLEHTICLNILDKVGVDETFTYEIWWYAFVWGTDELKKWPAFGPTSFTDQVWSDNDALGNNAFGGGDGILDFLIYSATTPECLDETADVSVQIQMDYWQGQSIPWDQEIN